MINYFKLADMKQLLRETDEWARRRIRAVYWRQWKRIRTKYRMLRALKLEHWKAMELANSRKGYWRMAQVIKFVKTKEPPCTERYARWCERSANQLMVSLLLDYKIWKKEKFQDITHKELENSLFIGAKTVYLIGKSKLKTPCWKEKSPMLTKQANDAARGEEATRVDPHFR